MMGSGHLRRAVNNESRAGSADREHSRQPVSKAPLICRAKFTGKSYTPFKARRRRREQTKKKKEKNASPVVRPSTKGDTSSSSISSTSTPSTGARASERGEKTDSKGQGLRGVYLANNFLRFGLLRSFDSLPPRSSASRETSWRKTKKQMPCSCM